ncbi:MAG: hypothetical protein KCHDKBKB_01966 [Elusimicrobia bacterium]|nr:hypothetical protein [Elusimicrobiota bacterium]
MKHLLARIFQLNCRPGTFLAGARVFPINKTWVPAKLHAGTTALKYSPLIDDNGRLTELFELRNTQGFVISECLRLGRRVCNFISIVCFNGVLAFAGMTAFSIAAMAAPLDMTVKGEIKDKINIERVSAPTDVALKDVIPFSRLGQTDWMLTEELGYMDEEKQVALMDVHSPKTFRPSMIEFPKPPFFVQAYPPPRVPIIVDRSPNAPPPRGENETWTFLVVDQSNQLLKKLEGNTAPVEPIQWDGVTNGQFVLRTDEIYSSVLVIQETPEVSRTIVGDPIWLPALRYIRGNSIVFEFSNKRVYNDNKASFASALQVLVDQLMNELRKYEGAPFSVTIADRDLDLAQRRSQLWKKVLQENLLKPADQFSVKVTMPTDRGSVTQIVLEITK